MVSKAKKMKYRLNGENVYYWILNIITALVVLVSLIPLIYVFSASLMTKQEWTETGGVFLICKNPIIWAYKFILTKKEVYQAMGMSFARAIGGSVLSVWFAMLAGYAISKADFWGGKALLFFVLIPMLYAAGLIPNYLIIEATGLTDSFFVFIIPGALGAYGMLVFKQTFQNMPQAMLESAAIDGASEFAVLWRIAVPVNMPTVAVLILFSAVGHWNSWFDAFLYINENTVLQPLALYLRNLLVDTSSIGVAESQLANEGVKYALAIVGMLPILCIYPFFQKHFVKGVYTGAVKA